MSSWKKAYRIKSGSSQFPVYKDREKPAQVRVKDLLSRMTLEEKAAQMMWGMVGFTAFTAVAYAPTIPLIWAIYADVADYSEWKTGHRFTGMVFATLGFGLKAGLALGSASFLWIMAGLFNYDTKLPDAAQAVQGYRVCSGIVVAILFGACTVLLIAYQLNKKLTIQMADELAFRRSAGSGTSSTATAL
jgi:Na+/melibiose symporter-like transporter